MRPFNFVSGFLESVAQIKSSNELVFGHQDPQNH